MHIYNGNNLLQHAAIDECLFATRIPMAFLCYNPRKPSRYGFLLKEFNEVSFPFAHRVEAFFGKPTDVANATEYYVPKTEDVTLRLVDKVAEHQDLRGGHVTFDNYYTSYSLAQKLLDRGITCTGIFIHKFGS